MSKRPRNIALWLILPILCVGVGLPSSGCTSGGDEGVAITVFAAASLTDALREISQEFESRNPGTVVKLNFAGSQRLRSQLELGAKADVFVSANELQMTLAKEADLISGDVRPFASASMAVIAADGSGISTLDDLADSGTRVVMAHEGVPAGQYSLQLLEWLSQPEGGLGGEFRERVMANVVSEETSVKFVEQKVVLGQADAGILYRPGMLTATAGDAAYEIPMPATAQDIRATYPLAVLDDSSQLAEAGRFVEFVLSEPAQAVLARYGFDPP